MMEPAGRTVRREDLGRTWTIDSFKRYDDGNGNIFARIHEPYPSVIEGYYVNLNDVEELDDIPVYKVLTFKAADQKLTAEVG